MSNNFFSITKFSRVQQMMVCYEYPLIFIIVYYRSKYLAVVKNIGT